MLCFPFDLNTPTISPLKKANAETQTSIDQRKYDGYLTISDNAIYFDEENYNVHLLESNLGKEELIEEQKECAYISSSCKTMNKLAKEKIGNIDRNGTFKPKEEYNKLKTNETHEESKDLLSNYLDAHSNIKPYIEKCETQMTALITNPFCSNWSWNIFTGFTLDLESYGTFILGLLGFIVSCSSLITSYAPSSSQSNITADNFINQDFGNYPDFAKDYVTSSMKTIMEDPIIQEDILTIEGLKENEGSDIVSTILSLFFVGISIFNAIKTLSGFMLIFEIINSILSLYLPGLIIGLTMMIKSFTSSAKTIANIGWFWSNYDIR